VKFAINDPFTLALAALALAACGDREQPAPAQSSAPAAGLSVSDGRLVLPAVKGNPGAVYFTVHNGGDKPDTLDEAEVAGARMAMLHQTSMVSGHTSMQQVDTMSVPAGGDLVFAPGGRHVMAMDLDDSLKPGGTTNVTLSFASGEKRTIPAEILAAGNAR
jgi:copper(I)-binding protein